MSNEPLGKLWTRLWNGGDIEVARILADREQELGHRVTEIEGFGAIPEGWKIEGSTVVPDGYLYQASDRAFHEHIYENTREAKIYALLAPWVHLVRHQLHGIYIGHERNEVYLELSGDNGLLFLHHQDCCESVYVESIVGILPSAYGEQILRAEESGETYENNEAQVRRTWTFYKIDTNSMSITMRWLGASNGYYSESVAAVFLRGWKPTASMNKLLDDFTA